MKTKMNTTKTSDEWPLKPRGQAPLLWAMKTHIRENNGMIYKRAHRAPRRSKWEVI